MKHEPHVIFRNGPRKWEPVESANQRKIVKVGCAIRAAIHVATIVFSLLQAAEHPTFLIWYYRFLNCLHTLKTERLPGLNGYIALNNGFHVLSLTHTL